MPSPARARRRATLSRLKLIFGIPPFLAIAGYVLVESLIEIICGALPTWQAQLLWLGTLAAAALFAFHRWNTKVTRTLDASHLGRSGTDRLHTRRGLIVLLGLDSQREDGAVAKLLASTPNVEYLALLGTPETQSRHVAADIVEKLAPAMGHRIAASHVRIFEQGNNSQSVADFEQDTTDAIAWMLRQGLEAFEIVVDTSAGRRAMGYGALIAAENADVEVQYLALAWNHMANQPVPGAEMFKVGRERHAHAPVTV